MWLADVAIAVRTAAATCMLLVIEHWQRPSEAAAALALGVHGDGKRIVSRTLPLLRPGEGEGVRHTRARLRWLAGPLLTPLRTLRSPGESPLHMHPVLLGTSNPPDAHAPVSAALSALVYRPAGPRGPAIGRAKLCFSCLQHLQHHLQFLAAQRRTPNTQNHGGGHPGLNLKSKDADLDLVRLTPSKRLPGCGAMGVHALYRTRAQRRPTGPHSTIDATVRGSDGATVRSVRIP